MMSCYVTSSLDLGVFFLSSPMASSVVISSNLRWRVASSPPFRLRGRKVDTNFGLAHSNLRCFCASSPPPPPKLDSDDNSTYYKWCAGIGMLGFIETSYLTFTKLFGVDAFCPVAVSSAAGCGDVLNSDYAVVFGIPLPLIGMAAYGVVALLGLQLSRNSSNANTEQLRLALLGTTTSMATASAYFLYILSTNLSGASCSYCLSSAALSFILFLFSVKDLGLEEIQKVAGLQIAAAGIIVASLTASYNSIQPQLSLEPFETEITTTSTPFAISLAKHLDSIGAKMYGAFWCTHCNEQKQILGREAGKIINYVECFPNGAGKGRTMTKECADVGMEGFPTWVINGKLIDGEQELRALASASGYTGREEEIGESF